MSINSMQRPALRAAADAERRRPERRWWAIEQSKGGRVNVRVEDEYFDVLQNIESAIVAVFEGQRRLVDREVVGAIESLVRTYESEDAGRPAGPVRLSERARLVYDVGLPRFGGHFILYRIGVHDVKEPFAVPA